MVIPEAPQNLIGDNAYDSDKLDTELRRYGIEMIAPHRRNRRNTTQDSRRLRPCDRLHYALRACEQPALLRRP